MPDLRLIVFDLDGTLIDSEQDLAGSVNAMLTEFGRHTLPLPVIRSYIGDGASMLVRRALGDPEQGRQSEELLQEATSYFLLHYAEHKLDHTRLIAGVRDALEALRAEQPQALMAVLTNKPVNPSRQICQALGIADFFFLICGGDSFARKKPDPMGLESLMKAAGRGSDPVTAEETVLLGDSLVDLATAAAAGTFAVGCTFGLTAPEVLREVPDVLFADDPSEWTACCRALPASVRR